MELYLLYHQQKSQFSLVHTGFVCCIHGDWFVEEELVYTTVMFVAYLALALYQLMLYVSKESAA